MKAVTHSKFGGPEVLKIVDLLEPRPGPGQIRVTSGPWETPVDVRNAVSQTVGSGGDLARVFYLCER